MFGLLDRRETASSSRKRVRKLVRDDDWRQLRLTDVLVRRNVECRTRDGAILRADIYAPADSCKYPAVLIRTPYGKEGGLPFDINPVVWAGKGLIIVVQDVRGRGCSDGEWYPFRHERDDGYDTVQWVAGLEGCNGDVGMVGFSYLSATCWYAAISNPPALKALACGGFPASVKERFFGHGGSTPFGQLLEWVIGLEMAGAVWRGKPERLAELARALDDRPALFEHIPYYDIPCLRGSADYWWDWMTTPSNDPYWDEFSILDDLDDDDVPQIPVLHIAGWYDIAGTDAIPTFLRMCEAQKDPAIRSAQRLIVGPWTHSTFGSGGYVGERDFGIGAGQDLKGQIFGFLKRWLCTSEGQRQPRATDQSSRVRFFVMGSNEYEQSAEWPPYSVTNRLYYLHSSRESDPGNSNGHLDLQEPCKQEYGSFVYDPLRPVQTRGGQVLGDPGFLAAGAFDQRSIMQREDVLVYTSSPLESAIKVVGNVKAMLYVSTTAMSTDFCVSLLDVAPDGTAWNLCDGIARVNGITPGEAIQIEIEMGYLANLFVPGHRIGLRVCGSNFPAFSRNLNTCSESGDPVAATQTVFYDQQRASHLVLPVVSQDLSVETDSR